MIKDMLLADLVNELPAAAHSLAPGVSVAEHFVAVQWGCYDLKGKICGPSRWKVWCQKSWGDSFRWRNILVWRASWNIGR